MKWIDDIKKDINKFFGRDKLVPAWTEEPCATSDFEGEVNMSGILRTYPDGTMAICVNDGKWRIALSDGMFPERDYLKKWWRTHTKKVH